MSPIQGLTNPAKSFIRVGRIKKGMKDPETGGMKDLDYFRMVFDPSAKEIEEHFKSVYGEKPVRINIRLAFRSVAEVWDANYECYKKGGLIAKAGENENGLYWLYYRDPDTSEVLVRDGRPVGTNGEEFIQKKIDIKKPIYSYMGQVKQPDDTKKQQMVPVYLEPAGRLNVVVPEIAHLRVGFMEFCPGSPRDIRTISAELAAIDLWAKNVGKDITGIPMVLTRREEEVTVNINGTLSRKKSWVVHIEVGGEWGGKALESLQMKALPDTIMEGEVIDIEEDDDFLGEPKQIAAAVAVTDEDGWSPPEFDTSKTSPEKPAPKPAPKPKVTPVGTVAHETTGEVPLSRPYSPAVFKQKVNDLVNAMPAVYEKAGTPLVVGKDDGKILASIIDAIFGGIKGEGRHVVCSWLIGKGSTKEMDPAQIKALFHIMGIKGEPRYESAPSVESITEFRQAYEYIQSESAGVKE